MSPRKSKVADPAPQAQREPAESLAASRLANVKVPFPVIPKVKPIPTDDDFVVGSKWTPIRRTGAYESSCWLYAPARLEFLAEASDALVTVAELMGLTEKQIRRVQVILQRSTKRLFIRPLAVKEEEAEESIDYFDVSLTSNDYLSINIRSLLQEHGLEVKTGYQERYPVRLDPDSAVGPALVVDLTKVEERRQTSDRRAKQAAKAAAKESGEVAPVKAEKAKRGKAKASAEEPAGQTVMAGAVPGKAEVGSTPVEAKVTAVKAVEGATRTGKGEGVKASQPESVDVDKV